MLQILPCGIPHAHCPKGGLRNLGGAGLSGVSLVHPPRGLSLGRGRPVTLGVLLVVGEGLGLAGVRQTDVERSEKRQTEYDLESYRLS